MKNQCGQTNHVDPVLSVQKVTYVLLIVLVLVAPAGTRPCQTGPYLGAWRRKSRQPGAARVMPAHDPEAW